jgi:fibronectin-binding autotransporter adhesin
MKHALKLTAAAAIFVFATQCATAQTWNLATGGTWNATASWSPTTIPNATGASAIFNGAATANNPDQTANRTITLDGQKTVGSIVFNTDLGAFNNAITTGTGSAPNLIFNNGGSGATVTTMGSGTGNNTFSGGVRLDDNLTATVNDTAATSANGSLVVTQGLSGTGGFTKAGDGMATFSTAAKSYSGATNLIGGRLRMSNSGVTSGTTSFTINGGQLDFITATAAYTLGTGPLNLSGAGPTTGPFAAFPGVIRPDTNLAIVIANPSVVLQSDSTLHSQGSASGSITLSGNVSGAGRFIAGAVAHDANIGQIILSGTNSYTGGTTVNAGTLAATGSSVTAFGTGNVSVVSAGAAFGGSFAKLAIQSGATNAIADTATLSLAGGNVAAVADDGYADLSAGINETVGGLVLGGTTETIAGTYGSSTSGATFQFDEYFAGSGMITLAPPAGVPGDYNNNGTVDAGDYVVWRKGGPLANDPTPGVQPSDYGFWRAHFGSPPGAGAGLQSGSAVPEPATLILAAPWFALLLSGRRGRR